MPSKEYANKPYFNESSANERLVRGYPPPGYFGMFMDFMTANEMSMSRTVTHILKDFFDRMTPEEKARVKDVAERNRAEHQQKKTA
jgi:hypothetical protein